MCARVCMHVHMCPLVHKHVGPWQLHLALRDMGSHGRFKRVRGRNSAIRFLFLKDYWGFWEENPAEGRTGSWFLARVKAKEKGSISK